jgi:RNA polymerase sigma-70 factor (ECF subfamily)
MTTTEPDTRAEGWALVTAAQAGDRDAFGELFTRYQPTVYRYVRSRIRDRDLADDLTADTFLSAWRAIGSVHDQGRDVAAWLVTIARNKVLDHAKSSTHNHELIPTRPIGEYDPGLFTLDGPEVTVLGAHQRVAAADTLGCYIALLPDSQQESLRLRYVHEMDGAQMAEVLGCTPPAARQTYRRATANLHRMLTAAGHTTSAGFTAAAPAPRPARPA